MTATLNGPAGDLTRVAPRGGFGVGQAAGTTGVRFADATGRSRGRFPVGQLNELHLPDGSTRPLDP